jgi:hypothetical protein
LFLNIANTFHKTGAQQVLQADAFVDLRSIAAVRQANQLIARPLDASTQGADLILPFVNAAAHADAEDEGGEEALARHHDKPALRMRRSFELLMKTGHVVRFEVCMHILQACLDMVIVSADLLV